MASLLHMDVGLFFRLFSYISFVLLLCLSAAAALAESDPGHFITVWDTTIGGPDRTIEFGAEGDYEIHWESLDGSDVSGSEMASGMHILQFPEPGRYRVRISPDISAFFPIPGDTEWVELAAWGNVRWTSLDSMFAGMESLEVTAEDTPHLLAGATMHGTFEESSMQIDLSQWDVSSVVDMQRAFADRESIPAGIEHWDVSSVTDMSEMFADTGPDIPSLGSWDVSAVTTMQGMFYFSEVSDVGIAQWDVSNVQDMSYMFAGTRVFNENIGSWDISSATEISGMFERARLFNADLSAWDVSQVRDFSSLFRNAESFNQSLSTWVFSSAENMLGMLDRSGLDVASYDAFLEALAVQPSVSVLELGAFGLKYCDAEAARQTLLDNGWRLFGDLQGCQPLAVTDRGVHFGVATRGEALTREVMVTNTGNDQDITIDSVALDSGSDVFSLVNNDCGATLAPGGSCALSFAAQAGQLGLHRTTLTIDSSGSGGALTVPVSLAVVNARPESDGGWRDIARSIDTGEFTQVQEMFDLLAVFYLMTNGADWHNDNGWLNPEIHPCGWYGVGCYYSSYDSTGPSSWLDYLDLRNNNLSGSLTSFRRLREMARIPHRGHLLLEDQEPERLVDLRDNPIETIESLPTGPGVVRLAGMGVSGELPPFDFGQLRAGRSNRFIPSAVTGTHYLELAGNQFSGQLPSSWQFMALKGLDLSQNNFAGNAASFFAAMDKWFLQDSDYIRRVRRWYENEWGMHWTNHSLGLPYREYSPFRDEDRRAQPLLGLMAGLHLAGNQLDVIDYPILSPNNLDGDSSFFVSLCWNQIAFTEEQLNQDLPADFPAVSYLEGVGDEVAACQNVERQTVGTQVSGSWYAPSRDGEGMNLMQLENGSLIALWYMHAEAGRQIWMLGQGEVRGKTLEFSPMTNYAGVFGQGYDDTGDGDGRFTTPDKGFGQFLEATVLDGDTVSVAQAAQFKHGPLAGRVDAAGQRLEYFDGFPSLFGPYSEYTPIRQLNRLTSLAGTSCDNQHEHQWVSGLWYEPESDGEGLVIEFTSNEQAVVYWYTYTPDGSEQAWMLGVGSFDGQRLVIENMRQPQHTGDVVFDTAGIEQDVLWGSLEIEFADENTAELRYDSVMEGYGVGTRQLTRLARPMLASCEAGMH